MYEGHGRGDGFAFRRLFHDAELNYCLYLFRRHVWCLGRHFACCAVHVLFKCAHLTVFQNNEIIDFMAVSKFYTVFANLKAAKDCDALGLSTGQLLLV